jgi:fluoride exporter
LTPLVVIGIGLAGGIGAVARFALDGLVGGRVASEFPLGTLVVNLLGAFVLGVLVGAAVGGDAYRLEGTGLIGGFTTFSTWVFESHRLGEDGELRLGVLNLAVSLGLGLGAAWAGKRIGSSL